LEEDPSRGGIMSDWLVITAVVVVWWLGQKVWPSAPKDKELREVIIWLFRMVMIAGFAFQLRAKLM
jgi:hypothetical protein